MCKMDDPTLGLAQGVSTVFEAWIPLTIAAAFFQNLRSALQKHLKGRSKGVFVINYEDLRF